MRLPNDAAIDKFEQVALYADCHGWGLPFPASFLLGVTEAWGDATSEPDDLEAYDAGREIARALLGLDSIAWEVPA